MYQFFTEFTIFDSHTTKEVLAILPAEKIEHVHGFDSVAEGTFQWSHSITVDDCTDEEKQTYGDTAIRVETPVFQGLNWEIMTYYIELVKE